MTWITKVSRAASPDKEESTEHASEHYAKLFAQGSARLKGKAYSVFKDGAHVITYNGKCNGRLLFPGLGAFR